MAIGFNNIPGNVRAPIISFEVNSGGQFESVSRLVLIGHKNSGAAIVDNVPTRVNDVTGAIALSGRGSMLAEMLIAARRNAPAQDIWLLSVPATGTAEVRTLTVGTVPATGGPGVVEIAGEPVSMTVGAGDSASTVATALAAAINGYQNALTKSGLPFTATAASNVVTLTARHAGSIFSDVEIFVPTVATGNAFAGLLTAATTTAGAGDPNLAAGLAALGDDPFDWIVSPFCDAANMGRYGTLLSDISGRWAWNRQSYGHVTTIKTDTSANLTTFGLGYDTRHVTTISRISGAGNPTTPWAQAAAVAARVTPWLSDGALGNVSRNQTGLVVEGLRSPRDRTKWMNDYATRDAFIGSGLSTLIVREDGQVAIDKLVTMQRTDGAGNVDTTFRDIQRIGQVVYMLRFFRARLQAEHGQRAIADDNPGDLLAITTVKDIKATMVAAYRSMPGVVENPQTFAQLLDVERNPGNPNRVDIYAPPDMVNALDALAGNANIYSQLPDLSA